MLRFLQLDVFADHPGGGNPLGVVLGADAWPSEEMQRLAAWLDLVETTFVLAPTRAPASYRLRIFTPTREIPFAGHPTVGSAHAVLLTGYAGASGDGRLVQECGAGMLPVRVEGEGEARELFVAAPAARLLDIDAVHAPLLEAALGDRGRGALAPGFVEGGRRWWLAELASEAAVREWTPDHAAILALARASDSLGLCVFARAACGRRLLVVRAFPAGVGIVEDPASGAANGLIAAYLAACEPQGDFARGYRVSQGREIGHDASILIRIDADATVWVGGRTHTVIDGRLHWPPRQPS